MSKFIYYPTTAKKEATDYPYGRLRTSMFFSLEWNKKKGYRSTRQTINPKTGLLNKPKKSTYYPIMLLREDVETGHFDFSGWRFDSDPLLLLPWLSDNWEMFTDEQKEDIYLSLLSQCKISVYAQIKWCGSTQDDAIALYDNVTKAIVKALATPTANAFDKIVFPTKEEQNAISPKDFSPFKVTHHTF